MNPGPLSLLPLGVMELAPFFMRASYSSKSLGTALCFITSNYEIFAKIFAFGTSLERAAIAATIRPIGASHLTGPHLLIKSNCA